MKEFERKQLLERINREGATVGASIPDRITVQGEEVALQEFVFEVKRRDTVPPGERERVEQAKKNLRRERLQRKQRIEDEEIVYDDVTIRVEQVENTRILKARVARTPDHEEVEDEDSAESESEPEELSTD